MFAQSRDAAADGGDMLAEAEVDPLNKGRIDLPAMGRQDLLYAFQRPEDHTVAHPDQTPPADGLDHLRIEQPGPGHPPGLGRWTLGVAPRRVYPVAKVAQQSGEVILVAVGEKKWEAVRREHLHDLMDKALGHGEGTLADIHRQQQLGDRI